MFLTMYAYGTSDFLNIFVFNKQTILMKHSLLACAALFFACLSAYAQNQNISSPDGQLKVSISLTGKIEYTITHGQDVMIAPSAIALNLSSGEKLGVNPKLKNAKSKTVNETITAHFYKRDKIKDNYNELTLNFSGDYSVIFRVYNDGAAYRFVTDKKKPFEVVSEVADFNFSADLTAIVPYVQQENPAGFEQQFNNSFENTYTTKPLTQLDTKRLIILPAMVALNNGKKVILTEADLESYPGMYLNAQGKAGFTSVFAGYPKTVQQGGHNNLQMLVTSREPYIAKVQGKKQFPWRVIGVSAQDKQMADSDLVQKLASPSRIKDISWIKPGKVAWDWWNDWNIKNVDFKSGINNATYKYYIDFASKQGIDYVILDEGWAVNGTADLMKVVPEIDLNELIAYGKQKRVDIVLWAGYYAFDRDMENVCRHYAAMGVKGFKIDFMDRDDQPMTDFYYKAAETAAKYKLFVDFHGAYKPTGIQRTYPNVMNFEGVHGLEQMKWSPPTVDQVTYDVTMPYIRMFAGPIDYTQGAMRNAAKDSYRPVHSEPMSQGTRCRQLADYVIFESPFNMLCDSPSAYMAEPESAAFIARVPTVWDETIALDGKVGEYIVIARRKGSEWYIGALTNWTARELELDLSFITNANAKIDAFKDGANASRIGSDYKHETLAVPAGKKLKVSLAPGGGFVGRIF